MMAWTAKAMHTLIFVTLLCVSGAGCSKKEGPIFVQDGKVGIGTAKPQSELAVKGKISAQEIQVTLEGWADFVFEDGYPLRDLRDVKTFVNKNGHLPDVPSAADVRENGVSLGEMDRTLLQKVEELTLYVIELHDENARLAKRVRELEARSAEGVQ